VVRALDDITPADIDTLAVLAVSASKAVSMAVSSMSGTLRFIADDEKKDNGNGGNGASGLRSDGYEILNEDESVSRTSRWTWNNFSKGSGDNFSKESGDVKLSRSSSRNSSPIVLGLARHAKAVVVTKWEAWPMLLSLAAVPVCATLAIPVLWICTLPVLALMTLEWYSPDVSAKLREGAEWTQQMVVGTYVFVSTTWRFWWALTWAWVRAFFGSAKWW
jgi:hypothetical protein